MDIPTTLAVGYYSGLYCNTRHDVTVCFSKYQQRLSYDLLSSLARVLLDGTVFEIISSLREVQQLEERNLSNQRIKLINEQKCKMNFISFIFFCISGNFLLFVAHT